MMLNSSSKRTARLTNLYSLCACSEGIYNTTALDLVNVLQKQQIAHFNYVVFQTSIEKPQVSVQLNCASNDEVGQRDGKQADD
jgi:hypothetical protein